MSKLEELIKELCPDGVEYKPTKDIKIDSFWLMPATPSYIDSGVPYITSKNIRNGCIDFNDVKYISEDDYKTISSNRSIQTNDLLITMIGTIGESAFVEDFIEFYGQNMYLLRLNEKVINRKFYYYYFTSPSVKNTLISKKNTSSQGYIKAGSIESLKVPVPPLEVQREIVRILDNFTELTARKKQYEFYRDKLLFSEKANVKSVPLGDIAKFVYGYTDKAKDTGSARFVRITDISEDGRLDPYDAKYIELTTESRKYLLQKGDLLLARTGATYGKTLYFDADEPAVYASFLIKIILDNSIIRNRYYWHFSKSSLYWEQAERYVSKGGQQQFNTNAISRVKVPIPSLEVQDRIINVLDNFDAICSDLNIGLPAEIDARQKQYEFYRNLLLTFAETGIIIAQTNKQTNK